MLKSSGPDGVTADFISIDTDGAVGAKAESRGGCGACELAPIAGVDCACSSAPNAEGAPNCPNADTGTAMPAFPKTDPPPNALPPCCC